MNATDNVGNASTNSNNGSVTFDSTAPTVSATVIGQASGATVNGFIKKNTGYYVYANVTDAGSGVASVTANVANVTSGDTAVALSSSGGPFTAPGGGSYTYRSASLTSNSERVRWRGQLHSERYRQRGQRLDELQQRVGDLRLDGTDSSATVIGQASGATVNGFIKKNTGYYVYANVTDVGSGVASVTANVANVTSGDTAVALSSSGGPFTAPGGGSYTYRSASLTSNAGQSDGAVNYTVNATDNVGNASTNSTRFVTFDSTAPVNNLSLSGQTGGGSYLSGTTVYYKGSTAGSFTITNGLTDSGSGPASSTFADSRWDQHRLVVTRPNTTHFALCVQHLQLVVLDYERTY